MSQFFEVCMKCKRLFVNEQDWNEHRAFHSNKPVVPIKETIPEPVLYMDANESEKRAKTIRENNIKKKKLVAAGVDAQTMTPDEVSKRFDIEVKNGKVK